MQKRLHLPRTLCFVDERVISWKEPMDRLALYARSTSGRPLIRWREAIISIVSLDKNCVKVEVLAHEWKLEPHHWLGHLALPEPFRLPARNVHIWLYAMSLEYSLVAG